jgi:hypothetical protein
MELDRDPSAPRMVFIITGPPIPCLPDLFPLFSSFCPLFASVPFPSLSPLLFSSLPTELSQNLVCVTAGKGPQRAYYEERIRCVVFCAVGVSLALQGFYTQAATTCEDVCVDDVG